jgi:antitoxin (DNA-binding transcriptional repressor) of toxin-antitoxin stability system
VKTVTKKQAMRGFQTLGDMAHSGQTVLVTQEGKPWIKIVTASEQKHGKSAATIRARLTRISAKPINGVPEVLKRLRR